MKTFFRLVFVSLGDLDLFLQASSAAVCVTVGQQGKLPSPSCENKLPQSPTRTYTVLLLDEHTAHLLGLCRCQPVVLAAVYLLRLLLCLSSSRCPSCCEFLSNVPDFPLRLYTTPSQPVFQNFELFCLCPSPLQNVISKYLPG